MLARRARDFWETPERFSRLRAERYSVKKRGIRKVNLFFDSPESPPCPCHSSEGTNHIRFPQFVRSRKRAEKKYVSCTCLAPPFLLSPPLYRSSRSTRCSSSVAPVRYPTHPDHSFDHHAIPSHPRSLCLGKLKPTRFVFRFPNGLFGRPKWGSGTARRTLLSFFIPWWES